MVSLKHVVESGIVYIKILAGLLSDSVIVEKKTLEMANGGFGTGHAALCFRMHDVNGWMVFNFA